MGRFTVIPQDTFQALVKDAGILLWNFDIAAAAADEDVAGFTDDDLITATQGGIKVDCVPTYSDFGADVDNCPDNMLELKHLDGWACSISTTAYGTSEKLIKLQLGAVEYDEATKAISPRKDLKTTDFRDLWWVGEKMNGGFVAVKIRKGLSTGGLSLQTGKNAKGTTTLSITGHVSINEQEKMPMEFYSIDTDSDMLNSTLSALTIGTNSLVPAFNSAITEYTLATENATDVITAAAADPDATIVIKNGTTVIANGEAATWGENPNVVTVTVTKGSGTSEVETVYTITVTAD